MQPTGTILTILVGGGVGGTSLVKPSERVQRRYFSKKLMHNGRRQMKTGHNYDTEAHVLRWAQMMGVYVQVRISPLWSLYVIKDWFLNVYDIGLRYFFNKVDEL